MRSMKQGAPRLAFMLASIHSGSSTFVWPEVIKECTLRGITLLVFPGGRLESKDEYEYMRNRIFEFVRPGTVDGVLCWASSLSGFVAERKVEEALAGLDLPLVTFGLKIGGNPAVTMDAYHGMKSLLSHLAKEHGCRRIAFIAGPKAHSSAQERYKAYRDTLQESGLRYDPDLVALNTSWTDGRSAMQQLLDQRRKRPGADFDALCAASDLLAFDAAALLQERGFRIPADLALGGFNDSAESNMVSPTYTTVRMPFERQATQALRMLLARLEGKNPTDVLLKTSLVIRQSCGCLPASVRLAGRKGSKRWRSLCADAGNPSAEETLRFLQSLCHFSPSDRKAYLLPLARAWIECISRGAEGKKKFFDVLERIMDDLIFNEKDLGNLQDALSGLRIIALESGKAAKDTWIETWTGQARVLVSDAEMRRSNYRVWKERLSEQWMNLLAHALLCVKNLKDIVAVAGEYLPRLGVLQAHIVVENQETCRRRYLGGFYPDRGSPPDLPASAVFFPSEGEEDLSPAEFLPPQVLPLDPGSYAVEPLFSESRFLGYAVLGMGNAEAWIYEELRAQLSSALRGVLLFEQANEARQRAETAERLKSEFLANVTGELQDPIKEIETIARNLRFGEPRQEMEQIIALSERHRVLTRNLLDLSLSQVGAFGLDLKLAALQSFLPELCHAVLPLVCVDQSRILQALGLLADSLASGENTRSLSISAAWDSSGLGIRILSSAERARNEEFPKIDLALAKRIFLLHGGEVLDLNESGGSGFLAVLPFPSPKGFASRPRPREGILKIGLLTSAKDPIPQAWDTRRVGIEAASDQGEGAGGDSFDFAFLDPRSMDWNECEVARAYLANPFRARSPIFVPADSLHPGQSFRSVNAFLEHRASSLGGAYVIFAGSGGDGTPLFRALLDSGAKGSLRIAACASREGMELLARRESPALAIVEGRDWGKARAAAFGLGLRDCPLAVAASRFDDEGLLHALADRPRVIICNTGPTFDAYLLGFLERMALGREYLPALSGYVVMKAIFYLNGHFKEPVSRWKLSGYLAASEDYLSRIFRKQMGISLWEYLNRLRVGYAVQLLTSTSDPVAEIADHSGFQDQAYFCRVVKRLTGKTPSAIRRNFDLDVRKVQKPD
ncbi:MAG: transcriptional regulator [Spirochaetes bacterium]|nr:MAG: transcriptional regulator [Spirochaetota bacterium]